MTAADTVRVAITDAIAQQVQLLGRNDPRPQGQPFAQWVEPTHKLGVSAALDLDQLAQFVVAQIATAAAGPNVNPEVGKFAAVLSVIRIGQAAVVEFPDVTLRVLGTQAAWEPVSAEEELDDPFPPPTDPEPASERPGVICQHCGQTIVPAAGIGGGWRHVASGFLNCGPTHETPAEP